MQVGLGINEKMGNFKSFLEINVRPKWNCPVSYWEK